MYCVALKNLYLFGHPRATLVQGLQYYFPENFSWNLKFYLSDSFSDSSLRRIFDSENFRFPFFYEKWANMGREMGKIKLQKIVGN